MNAASLRRQLVHMLEHEQCLRISTDDLEQLRRGSMTKPKLSSLVSRMKKAGCGTSSIHNAALDPFKSTRFNTLGNASYKVYKIDATHDAVFHAMAHGISMAMYHHPLPASQLPGVTKILREGTVDLVLKTPALQKHFRTEGSLTYHRQFHVRNTASQGSVSWVAYAQKMRSSAKGSVPELRAMAMYANAEIHIYVAAPGGGYKLSRRITPSTSKGKRYLVRLLQKSEMHYDLLMPTALHAYQKGASKHATFWDLVDDRLLGQVPAHTINSPEKAQNLVKKSRENRNGPPNKNNTTNLPNENVMSHKKNFKWHNSPALR